MKATLATLLFCIASFYSFGTANDSTRFQIRRFTDENGMPQNSVNGMGMDNAGFVWLATHGGLVRFDGQKLTTFTKQMLSMDSDRFIKMMLDPVSGTLYAVNGADKLIALRNGRPIVERKYKKESDVALECVTPSRTGGAKIDTRPTADGYPQFNIVAGEPGTYYVYADQKVFFFKKGVVFKTIAFRGKPYFKPFPGEPSVRKKDIAETKGFVCFDNFMSINGKLFYHIGSEGTDFYHLSPQGIQNVELTGEIQNHPDFVKDKHAIRIVTNRFEGQAFAILGTAIYHVIYSEIDRKLHSTLLTDDYDIEQNMVFRLLYDQTNRTLFLGSFSQGLTTIRPKAFHVVTNKQEENFHNVYYTQLPFSSSSVIIQTGAVLGDHPAKPQTARAFADGLPTQRSSMLRDPKGRFWIFKDKRLTRVKSDGSIAEASWELDGKIPERMYRTQDGYIWISLRDGEIRQLSADADSSMKPVTVTRLAGTTNFFYEDKPGRIWLGTSDGLFLYNRSTKTTYPVKGLAGKSIRAIYSSAPDELWITTYGDGMFLITRNRLLSLPLDKNGYLRHAHDILEDENHHFWIPSNKGLFRISRQDLLNYANGKLMQPFFMYYNRDDGFLTNEFNGGCQPCGVKLDDGNYSLPSMNGLVWFKPSQIPAPYLEAPLFFENMQIDDRSHATTDTVRLNYDFAHVSFDVATAFTGISDNLEIYYSLAGTKSDTTAWTRIAQDQRLDIYGLNPGTYTLTVRKPTGFGGKKIDRQLVLIVASPWFLSWWFISLLILGISALVWLFLKWRLRSLIRQNALLSEKIEERTSHLTKALEDLKASDEALQTQLQIQMRIIGVINHDLHSPLRYLSHHVPRLIEQVKPCLTNHETAHLASAISKSILKMYQLADDLLRFIKATYNKKGQITYEDVLLKALLEQKASFFAEIAQEGQTTLAVECEPGLTVRTNYMMLEILVHNLVDNALKHTYSQSVTLKARRHESGEVEVAVVDTGYGMYPEMIEWLNDDGKLENGKEANSGGQVPANLGLGLIMVKEIGTLLDAKVIASTGQNGTTIAVLFDQ